MDKDQNTENTQNNGIQQTRLLLIVVLIAAVVVPFLSTTMAVSTLSGKLASLKSADGHGAEGEESHGSVGGLVFYDPMDFLVNLADTEVSHYLKTTVSLGSQLSPEEMELLGEGGGGHGGGEGPQPELFHHIKMQEPIVRDIIISVVSSYPMMSLVSAQGKRELKETLSVRLQQQLGTENLSVYFTAFTLQ